VEKVSKVLMTFSFKVIDDGDGHSSHIGRNHMQSFDDAST